MYGDSSIWYLLKENEGEIDFKNDHTVGREIFFLLDFFNKL